VTAAYSITIGIATRGRAAVLCAMLAELRHQTRPADHVIVCGGAAADVAGVAEQFPEVTLLLGAPGLTRQRNAIVEAALDADLLLFFDDDFLPAPSYIAAVEDHMRRHPATMVATGRVLADGINGPGLSVAEGLQILGRSARGGSGGAGPGATRPMFSGYGCNMALRMAPLRAQGIRFDERLQLYCWQEDVDLSRRLAAFGDILRLDDARGVHLGVKSGRSAGVKLGYSQIANPLYLAGKGAGYPVTVALTLIARNMAKNLARALWSEAWVDRRGRLRGNVLALGDLLRGRMRPERVAEV
jgi:GT2 family glycosyltransferase